VLQVSPGVGGGLVEDRANLAIQRGPHRVDEVGVDRGRHSAARRLGVTATRRAWSSR
jgi:hypothetical protein